MDNAELWLVGREEDRTDTVPRCWLRLCQNSPIGEVVSKPGVPQCIPPESERSHCRLFER